MKVHRIGVAAVLVMAAAWVGVLPAMAQAQQPQRITVNMRDGGGAAPAIARRNVEKYADLLSLSGEQKESALTIHDGYAAAMKTVQKARQDAMADLSRSAQDSGDHGVFLEKMPAIEKEFREKSGKLEKGFMEDLKSLCSAGAQEQAWARVERMRRREVELRRGTMSGESMDLVEVVGGFKFAPDTAKSLSPTLEEYEGDLDAQLKARQQAMVDTPAFEAGKPFDMEKMQASLAKAREVGTKVREVNDRYARKLEAMVPEDKKAEFHAAVRQAMFPTVYRPSRVARDLDKALALKDLTPEQKESLSSLRSSYKRDLGPANDSWAAAIEETEKGDSGDRAMVGPGGGLMAVRMNDEPPKLADARKARRELDDKAREKMKSTLSEGQMAAIQPQPGEETEGFEVNNSVILRSTIR